jgi:hypothetical protein
VFDIHRWQIQGQLLPPECFPPPVDSVYIIHELYIMNTAYMVMAFPQQHCLLLSSSIIRTATYWGKGVKGRLQVDDPSLQGKVQRKKSSHFWDNALHS